MSKLFSFPRPAGLLRRFLKAQRGVAMIEFAIVFPVFFVLLFGGIEISRLILIQQKLEKAGYVLADITTQYNPATRTGATGEISVAELNTNVFPQLGRIMSEYRNPARQAAILTSVEKSNNRLTIRWQIASAADTLAGCDTQKPPTCVQSIVNNKTPSQINPSTSSGQPTSFPAEQMAALAQYNPTGTGNFIVSEVFYNYQPILQKLLQGVGSAGGAGMAGFDFFLPARYYVKRTYFIPRNGPLLQLPPAVPVP